MENPKTFNVISLDENKISIIDFDGQDAVKKITSKQEYENLVMAETFLQEEGEVPYIDGNLKIKVPKILSWDEKDGSMIMEFCKGINLEEEMRKMDSNRCDYLDLIKSYLEWSQNTGFKWMEIAPRNMLLDLENKCITILDFEKDFEILGESMSDEEFYLFCQKRIAEEMSAFLSPDEFDEMFPGIWNYKPKNDIMCKDIVSGRRRYLARQLYGEDTKKLTPDQYVEVEKLLAGVMAPFYINNQIFLPQVALEEVKGSDRYAQAVIEISKRPKEEWPSVIAAYAK